MHFAFRAVALGAAALVAVSCAPKPAPIMPEVVYDKFGDAVVYECRPSTVPVSPNYPERLPVCEHECPLGTQPNPITTTAARVPECVPIPDDNDDDTQQQRPNITNVVN